MAARPLSLPLLGLKAGRGDPNMTLQRAKLELKEKSQKQLLAVCRSKTSAPDSGHCATPGDPGHGQGHGVMVLHQKFQVLSPKKNS